MPTISVIFVVSRPQRENQGYPLNPFTTCKFLKTSAWKCQGRDIYVSRESYQESHNSFKWLGQFWEVPM